MDFVQSLGIQKRLFRKKKEHRGCVNTLSFNSSGSLLLSGYDDMTLVLWNWEAGTPVNSFHTGHENNVLHAYFMPFSDDRGLLHAQFMPFSDDRSIVTAGADGTVRHLQMQEGGGVVAASLVELEKPVHRLAVEPGSPHTFYSCGGDGSVWRFDLRGNEPTELFSCASVNDETTEIIELYAIAMDQTNPNHFAVSGSDEYVRLYDSRTNYVNGYSPVEYFCPPHLIGQNKDGVTGLAFSQAGEMLASYSDDDIYLFKREHGLHVNNFKVGKTLPPSMENLPAPQSFTGHQNRQTVKGVNFLGPNCDFVASGSDCGHLFIWRKNGGELMRRMKGDKRIVNCVEQHPFDTIVASSGIDTSIKIWAPGETDDGEDYDDSAGEDTSSDEGDGEDTEEMAEGDGSEEEDTEGMAEGDGSEEDDEEEDTEGMAESEEEYNF